MTHDDARGALHLLAEDREQERRTLLLHIAISCPYDAAELSRRIARPQKAVHEDLTALMSEGAVHVHEAALRTSAAARIIAEASAEEVREVQTQALAELASGDSRRTATLVALAESGCSDEPLLHMLIRAVGERPNDAAAISALSSVSRARGYTDDEMGLLRAADAAAHGRTEQVIFLTDGLLSSPSAETSTRAAILAAGAHIQRNRLEQAAALYRHTGAERIGHDGAWAAVAALGRGDLEEATQWRTAMGDDRLTSHAAGLFDMVDGLLKSAMGTGEGALDALARSVSALAHIGPDVFLPETPAALAALVGIGRGEPAMAEVLLDRALQADLGGAAGRRRHVLLLSWALMAQGKMNAAERTLETLDAISELNDRDRFLHLSLRAGLARRRTDTAAMKAAWEELRGHTFGMSITLYDLLPLGDMMIAAARLRDADRMRDMVRQATALLERLGSPATWSAPFHWHGVQAAFQAEDPAALIPHANALVAAGTTSPYAATLAKAGNTWLEVLRGEADDQSVLASAHALARSGHVWDGARLAGQAALQHPERESALSMMQVAREISKGHEEDSRSGPRSSILTSRELEVGRLVLEGHGYRAIGEQLFISPKTVEHHVARMRSRLGATSRGDLLEKLHDVISDLDQ